MSKISERQITKEQAARVSHKLPYISGNSVLYSLFGVILRFVMVEVIRSEFFIHS